MCILVKWSVIEIMQKCSVITKKKRREKKKEKGKCYPQSC